MKPLPELPIELASVTTWALVSRVVPEAARVVGMAEISAGADHWMPPPSRVSEEVAPKLAVEPMLTRPPLRVVAPV